MDFGARRGEAQVTAGPQVSKPRMLLLKRRDLCLAPSWSNLNTNTYIRTSHTTTRLPLWSLAHSRFCVRISEAFASCPLLRAQDLSQALRRKLQPVTRRGVRGALAPCPHIFEPRLPTFFDEWGRMAWGDRQERVWMLWQRGEETATATPLLAPQRTRRLEPLPAPSPEAARSTNHLPTKSPPSRPW